MQEEILTAKNRAMIELYFDIGKKRPIRLK
jgi:hypothetical protein